MKKTLLSLACLGLAYGSQAAPVLVQNFESSMTPFTVATTGGGGGWQVTSGSYGTQVGTIAAHTNYAILLEAASASTAFNNPSKMTSPAFSLVGLTTPYLAYDVTYFGAVVSATSVHEQAWVEVSTDGGTTWALLDSMPKVSSWSTRFVNMSAVTPTATTMVQFCYTDNGSKIIGAAVDNIMVYDASATDLALVQVTPSLGALTSYGLVGTTMAISGTAINYGAAAVSTYTANYKIGTAATVSSTITTAIAPFSGGTFSIATPVAIATATKQNVKVWVSATADAYNLNDTMSTAINGYAFAPKKRVLFEEGTGAWCGFCVRGIIFMDSLYKIRRDFVSIVSVHDKINGPDGMAGENTSTTQYDKFVTSKIGGYPSMVIDRRYTDDPSGAIDDFKNDSAMFGFVNIGITGSVTGATYTASVQLEPAMDLAGDYRLELVITEDSVNGTGSGFQQHNYYGIGGSFNSTYMKGVGYDFNALPSTIPAGGIRFPYVARYTLPTDLVTTPNGVAGSLPSTMTAKTNYKYTFAPVTIPSTWVSSRLHATVIMIDNNTSSPMFGMVMNSANTTNDPFKSINNTAIENVPTSALNGMNVFPNPATEEAHVQFELNTTSTVNFAIYDMTGRQVFTAPAEQMTTGKHQINVSTSDIASGLYNVVIRTENGTSSSRLSVVK